MEIVGGKKSAVNEDAVAPLGGGEQARVGVGLLGSFRRRAAGAGRRSPPKTSAARANEQPLPLSFHGGKLKYLVEESWQPSNGVSMLDIGPHVTP